MASTSRGEMTMPSTPWVIAVSTSAVCLGVWSWPSLSTTVMLPSASASAFIWFIMWTKNGKLSPGTDAMMVSGLSACAAAPPVKASPTAPARSAILAKGLMISSRPICPIIRGGTKLAGLSERVNRRDGRRKARSVILRASEARREDPEMRCHALPLQSFRQTAPGFSALAAARPRMTADRGLSVRTPHLYAAGESPGSAGCCPGPEEWEYFHALPARSPAAPARSARPCRACGRSSPASPTASSAARPPSPSP